MRVRLILSFSLIVLVAILAVVIFTRFGAAAEVRQYISRGGMLGVENLVTDLEVYYRRNGSWQGVDTLLVSQAENGMGMMGRGRRQGMPGMYDLLLVDAQREVVVDTGGVYPAGQRLSSDELASGITLNAANGDIVGYLLLPGAPVVSPAGEDALVTRLMNAALRAGLIALGLALIVSLALSGRLIVPLRQMTAAAQRMAAGQLSQQVPVHGKDELARLAQAFNSMSTSLQRSEQRRLDMTADIAHELRNPLAVQRANLEALLDGVYPLTTENLQPVLNQTALLTRLVEDLRTLALADAGELKLEFKPVNLRHLLEAAVQQFQSQAASRNLSFELELKQDGADLQVWGDPDRLAQVLNNLLGNSLRYTPDGGKIRVALELKDEMVELRLRDSGPGIPPEALPFIFDRFYRADRARSRAEGSTGLGLAISRQLILAHDGTIYVENHPQGGAVFIVRLPLATGQRRI
jgi:two-component system OmpR family sensor kinase/two-component system sensor histidine kinase BaeS